MSSTQGPGPGSDEFDPKQHIWDGTNWWTMDRQFWWDGTRWWPRDTPQPSPEVDAMTAAPVKPTLSTQAKWLLGCGIAFAVLLVLVVAIVVSYLTNPVDY